MEDFESYERSADYGKYIDKYAKEPHPTTSKPNAIKSEENADFIIVYSKSDAKLYPEKLSAITTFVNNIKQAGLQVEEENGLILDDLVGLKISAPKQLLSKFAADFKLELSKDHPNYKLSKVKYKFLRTILTNPTADDPIARRAPETLSGNPPSDFTSAERILIVNRILTQIKHGSAKSDTGYESLIKRKIILTAYPLHDSPYQWTDQGPLSDRQLLARYWANIRCFIKAQPLHVIEKYFGPEVAFYYAWMEFYNMMLIPAVIIGLICFTIGIILYFTQKQYLLDEVCNSNILLCPVCPSQEWCSFVPLKNSCVMMRLGRLFENPATVVYSILMCFWGVIFVVLWRREQAILRLRWNLNDVTVDRSARPQFVKVADIQRISSVTGDIEYYPSLKRKLTGKAASYIGVLVMLFLYCLAVFAVTCYRLNLTYYGRKSKNKYFRETLSLIQSVTSSFLTLLIMIFYDFFTQRACKLFTEWENPRTQDEFNRSYTTKVIVVSFGNVFLPIMYLAFIKGHFYTHPGDPTQWTFLGIFKADVCSSSGCLVELSILLAVVMVIKNTARLAIEVITPFVKVCIGRYKFGSIPIGTQWEEEFVLVPTSSKFLYVEYIEMVLQYGFMTFFLVSLPIAPLLAFINNIFEVRFDAMKMLKKFRRIIPKKVTGIEEWNTVLQIITVLGAISNPLLIAFGSMLIPRYIYLRNKNSLKGFINSTLSEFAVEDYSGHVYRMSRGEVVDTCYYIGMRYPPSHHRKYERTYEFWYQFSVKLIFFIVLENICLLLSLFLGYIIPEIPREVEIKLEHDQNTLKNMRLKQNKT